jgi:drug/metabolite transporter (DMT)-like permease
MNARALFLLRSIVAVALTAGVGGLISRRIHAGELPWWSAVVPALLGGSAWGWMCRQGQPLVYASLVYDLAATLTYVGFFVATGDRLSLTQGVGVVLSIVGIALVST